MTLNAPMFLVCEANIKHNCSNFFKFRAVKAHLFSTKAKLERWHSIILGKLEFLRTPAFSTFLDYYCFLLC